MRVVGEALGIDYVFHKPILGHRLLLDRLHAVRPAPNPDDLDSLARQMELGFELSVPVWEGRGETERSVAWFVGASIEGVDQTERFLSEGIWEHGFADDARRIQTETKAMEPGDRIAIKSTFVRKSGHAFATGDRPVSMMRIKATGTITANSGDGRSVEVDWDPSPEQERDWCFFTHRPTITKVDLRDASADWRHRALVAFAFEGQDQEIPRFLAQYWGAASPGPRSLADVRAAFEEATSAERLVFPSEVLESLHLGLWADPRRHFAVLTGLSGTGKTRLARHYAEALVGAESHDDPRIAVIPVQPGWHDPTPLLGYANPLAEGKYHRPEFLNFLIRAHGDRMFPYVCILDEMNLSHPEQYLAPLLSAMEGVLLEVHSGNPDNVGIPRTVPYPENLVVIGTVNMDETTMGISDKVTDRAFTLEFWDIEPGDWPRWDDTGLPGTEKEQVRRLLVELTAALRPARLHFGWRVVAEIAAFLERRHESNADLTPEAALDRVIYAKVLPKLRGDDSPRHRKALTDCRKVLDDYKLARSRTRVEELLDDLDATGSFRFWR